MLDSNIIERSIKDMLAHQNTTRSTIQIAQECGISRKRALTMLCWLAKTGSITRELHKINGFIAEYLWKLRVFTVRVRSTHNPAFLAIFEFRNEMDAQNFALDLTTKCPDLPVSLL